uniref:Uncharacterized protein n=1 Tax=Anguilla anguilla TaxID=7936 RepID=A0A0E9XTK3_ANGAN
MKHKINTVVL